jgi:hypothetical protein
VPANLDASSVASATVPAAPERLDDDGPDLGHRDERALADVAEEEVVAVGDDREVADVDPAGEGQLAVGFLFLQAAADGTPGRPSPADGRRHLAGGEVDRPRCGRRPPVRHSR